MALLPSPQTLCIFGYTFSRQDAMAAVRTTLGSYPFALFFIFFYLVFLDTSPSKPEAGPFLRPH